MIKLTDERYILWFHIVDRWCRYRRVKDCVYLSLFRRALACYRYMMDRWLLRFGTLTH